MAVTHGIGWFKFIAIITIATWPFPWFKFFFWDLSIKLGNGSVSLKCIWNMKKNKSTSKVTILTNGSWHYFFTVISPVNEVTRFIQWTTVSNNNTEHVCIFLFRIVIFLQHIVIFKIPSAVILRYWIRWRS